MPEEKKSQDASQEAKIWAAAGYLWVISLVVLAARKNNDYIRFHANQGTLLFALSIIFMVIPILWFLNIVVAIAAIFGILKAWQGEKWELPALAGMAKSLGDWIVKTLKL